MLTQAQDQQTGKTGEDMELLLPVWRTPHLLILWVSTPPPAGSSVEQADQSPPGLDVGLSLWKTLEAPELGAKQATQILHPRTSGQSSTTRVQLFRFQTTTQH